MTGLLLQIEQNIRSRQLLTRGQRVVVAVSGGVDSMVLLHVLHELGSRNKWSLHIAHLNHQLRGRSSDADEGLVRRVATKLKLPLLVERADVRGFAREQKISLEMAARKLRHDFLARAAQQAGARTVALAHHADDQVELFFLRLFRGSGGEGLAGMKWRNGSPSNPRIALVRPLLNARKEDLKKYAGENRVAFREDASNASLDIQRNRIRNELLPLLKKYYQPALEKTVMRVMESVSAETEMVASLASDWLKLKNAKRSETKFRRPFSELPVALQRRCLQLQLIERGLQSDFDLVEKLRLQSDVPVMIRAMKRDKKEEGVPLLVITNSAGVLYLKKAHSANFDDASHEIDLRKARQVNFENVRIAWRMGAKKSETLPERKAGQEVFDADIVGSVVTLRHWRVGDRFQPIGMNVAVKLQDIFTNQRIPRDERHRLIVATTNKGDIFWVEGLRISERFKLTKSTNRRLQWRWMRR